MRRALPVLPLALPLTLLVACSSSHPTTVSSGAGTPAATPVGPGVGTAPSTSAVSRPATTQPPTAAATGAPGTRPGTRPGAPAGATPAAAAPASTATPAGTYTYDSQGTTSFGGGAARPVSGSATLTVAAAVAGRQTSTLHNSQGDTRQDLLQRPDGTYLTTLTVSSPALHEEFRFSPPALLLGDPARDGARWTWRATSTDGSYTASAENTVLRHETVTIGGSAVPTVVLLTKLVITGKDLRYTSDETNWVAPAYRPPVRTHSTGKGTYGAFAFSFDVTDTLRSVRPS